MDVAARLEAVEAENDLLRAKIEGLEGLLGMHALTPLVFGFTGAEARVFGVLMRRDIATKEMVMHGLYADRADNDVEIKIVDVFICKMRKKLKSFAIPIDTVWGQGYRLTSSAKEKVRAIIASEDPGHPFSDQKIVELLLKENINIARRTVAKYREMLGILPSSKRKKVF